MERDNFDKWATGVTSFVEMTGGRIVCYDDDMKVVAMDVTEFVLKLISAEKSARSGVPKE